MDTVNDVHQLLKKHFWEMTNDTSLITGKRRVLPEDTHDFLAEYADLLHVDMGNIWHYVPPISTLVCVLAYSSIRY
ncbi:Uncharacterised protein [Serratia rubidaea]|uniref:Uncharacterized protein n=1 Tax=Serratia rubidaea TaxID=61652 RepID=A0A3S4GQ02_SERRU|nr:Uncharacterised protein [Serratia rubidaea]